MRLRQAVRALILDPDDRVLLVHFDLRPRGDEEFWACPGGGLEPGEDAHAALRRELAEEVGLVDPDIGPALWSKVDVWSFGDWDGQVDTCHLVRTPAFEPHPDLSRDELAAEFVTGMRWWTPTELAASDVMTSPRSLRDQLRRLLTDGVPAVPVELHGHEGASRRPVVL
ncbi:MAG TPA: NUDIX domain-containing protein [Propioniciclava tarda]|nr:NUDIX domain-containing protein [Propioniciclava tarda]